MVAAPATADLYAVLLLTSTLAGFCVRGEAATATAAAARAFFVFGDSLVDNGNNNFLATTARADEPPYGIDYPTHLATGRFSNGLNIADIISEHIGGRPILPYLSPQLTGKQLLNGANFASAGIGILNDTGIEFANIIRITEQIQNFRRYQQRLAALVGRDKAVKVVKRALVLVTLGGNDFVNNYYLVPFSARSQQFNLPDYVTYIISEYKKILATLLDLGARRMLVTGTGPIGCVPAVLAMRGLDGNCDVELQRAAGLFNPQLVRIINELNTGYGSGRGFIMAANTDAIHMNFIDRPKSYGFTTSKVACCGQGPYNGLGPYTAASNLCADRDAYVFWDAFHPTERANRIIVGMFMKGSSEYMHPMNLSTAASNLCADRDAYVFWDAFHPTERANRIIVGMFMKGSSEYMHPMNLSTAAFELDSRSRD